MLLEIADLLDAAGLARARALLEAGDWVDGRETAGPQAARVKHNQQLAPRGEAARALQALVLEALGRHAGFFSAALPKRVLPPFFNRYRGDGSHYGNHVDQAVRFAPDGTRVRCDVSCTVFLSDPAEYDGGELVIETDTGARRVKLPAGAAVIYPSGSVHRVEPVTRGARLASFFWIESMVRRPEQRRLLHELDRTLIALRERDPDSPESVALTGTYHNLLRMWADT
ncbi:Fe2+-dependent dioxygenase [Piscinibacter defluvii]|uniref:Fe2+-dependent dioxygenase n=1 Tax=Piscinibacter defluvii TaxID=1796922 RepID=UPI000FDF3BA3|nr:Fe2+-dependent dioxygenase [Piscinibacter defluvii]